MEHIIEVRWHGRGGQGAWTASELLARAAILEGKYIQSFPEFGPERMGAPIRAFTRVSEKPINLHCTVYNPNMVVVLDPTLLKTVPIAEGIQPNGTILINIKRQPKEIREQLGQVNAKLWTVAATEIALKILGRPITNTAMLGALVKATSIVSLESVEKVVKGRFPPQLAERNIALVKQAYEEVKSE